MVEDDDLRPFHSDRLGDLLCFTFSDEIFGIWGLAAAGNNSQCRDPADDTSNSNSLRSSHSPSCVKLMWTRIACSPAS